MPTPNSQAQAGAGSEGATETPQGGQADSLNNPGKEQKRYGERVNDATSPADIHRLIGEMRDAKVVLTSPEEKSPAKAEGELPPEAAIEGAEEAKPEGAAESSPEEAAETNPENAETAKPDDGKKDAEDETSAEEKFPERIRLTNFSKVEKLALQLKRDDPKLSLAQAETRAKAALGIKDEEVSTETKSTTTPVQTVASVDAKIAELRVLRTKASKEDLDFAEVDRLTNEIEALSEQKHVLRSQEAKKASDEQKAYDATYDASQKKAAGLYDFVMQPDSAGFKRMAEIDQQLEEGKDPLFNDPEKSVLIAQMVAKELLIAPKSAKAPAAKAAVVAKPAAAAGQAKGVPPVASGASRTSTSSTQVGKIDEEIKGLRTPEDLEKFFKKYGS